MSETRVAEGSRSARLWYETVRWATMTYCSLRGGVRVTGRENVPRSGGALLVSNHLSYLDVFVLGVGLPRRLSYVARSSLFVGPLGPLMRSVGGFPIDREAGGMAGLKETLRKLKSGSIVVLFPEGTRSRDGELGILMPGFAALARARVPIVPAGIAGTFEAWPRGRAVPRGHPIRVHYGPPIAPGEVEGLAPEALVGLVHGRLLEAQGVARAGLARDCRGTRHERNAGPPDERRPAG